MITSTALVLLMIPGVGFFYSGLARRKSALSLIWLSMMSTAVVSFQVSSPKRTTVIAHAPRISKSFHYERIIDLGLLIELQYVGQLVYRQSRQHWSAQHHGWPVHCDL